MKLILIEGLESFSLVIWLIYVLIGSGCCLIGIIVYSYLAKKIIVYLNKKGLLKKKGENNIN